MANTNGIVPTEDNISNVVEDMKTVSYVISNVYENVDYERSCLYTLGFDENQLQTVSYNESITYGISEYYGYLESSRIFGDTFDVYYYISVNDFLGNTKDHIIGALDVGYIGDHILARVQVKNQAFSQNIDNNEDHIFKERNYNGGVRIRKLHIKLLNKYGEVVNLNGANINLMIECTQEYGD